MALNRRELVLGLAACGAAVVLPAMAGSHVLAGPAFGTSWRIVLGEPADAARVHETVAAIVDEVDSTMSPYRPASELSRFNASATEEWQRMPESVCAVVSEALDIAMHTDGAFDPTVGPVVQRHGFGPITGALGSYRDIAVSGDTVRKAMPRLTLDLCGIAKGYALDRIASALEKLGVKNALIELGGEIIALGQHADGRAWQVAIEDPMSTEFAVQRIVTPGRMALATSGHTINGVRARASTSHIIDPHRVRPAETTLMSVSVLAPTAMQADALATALCAAGPEESVVMAKRIGASALFLSDGSIAPREVMTGSFAAHIAV